MPILLSDSRQIKAYRSPWGLEILNWKVNSRAKKGLQQLVKHFWSSTWTNSDRLTCVLSVIVFVDSDLYEWIHASPNQIRKLLIAIIGYVSTKSSLQFTMTKWILSATWEQFSATCAATASFLCQFALPNTKQKARHSSDEQKPSECLDQPRRVEGWSFFGSSYENKGMNPLTAFNKTSLKNWGTPGANLESAIGSIRFQQEWCVIKY